MLRQFQIHLYYFCYTIFDWEFCIKEGKDVTWVPNYVIKSPKDIGNYEINEKNSKYVVILISSSLESEKLKPGI